MNVEEKYNRRYKRRAASNQESVLRAKIGRGLEVMLSFPRQTLVATILLVALFAFEIFNFDTTRFALENLLGPVSFMKIQWAAILAIAFCSIDFAGLMRFFTSDGELDQQREGWYLMGAWILGATMNAMMTWWAISLTLLDHDFGNEVLSRDQLLDIVPVFVAVLVWLTRILFIGAFSVAGDKLFNYKRWGERREPAAVQMRQPAAVMQPAPTMRQPAARPQRRPAMAAAPRMSAEQPLSDDMPDFLYSRRNEPATVAPPPVMKSAAKAVKKPLSRPVKKRKKPMLQRASELVQDPIEELEYEPLEGEAPIEPVKKQPRRTIRAKNQAEVSKRVRQRPPVPGMRPLSAKPRG